MSGDSAKDFIGYWKSACNILNNGTWNVFAWKFICDASSNHCNHIILHDSGAGAVYVGRSRVLLV